MREMAGLTMLAVTVVVPLGVARAVLGMFVGQLIRLKSTSSRPADAQRG